jgi:hypothetical protein
MQLDQGNHSAAVLAGHLRNYFKTEKLSNVKADVDLVIFAEEEPEDEAPASKRAKLASSPAAAAASTSGNRATARCLQELTRFPAHNLILDGTVYFRTQQVRGRPLHYAAACLVLQCVSLCYDGTRIKHA